MTPSSSFPSASSDDGSGPPRRPGAPAAEPARETPRDRGGSGMLVSPQVRSDSGGPLPADEPADDDPTRAQAGTSPATFGREVGRGAPSIGAPTDLPGDASTPTAALASAWERLRRWDAERGSLPGEHWAVLAAGAWLFTRRPRSALMRLACLAGGAALMWRAAQGRDGLLAAAREPRAQAAPTKSALTPVRRPAAQPDDLPPSPQLAGSLEGVPWVDRRD